jgi:hypothetical protein
LKLRSAQAYWAPDSPVAELVAMDPEQLPRENLLLLVSELDRRFTQLWDKIQFERKLKEERDRPCVSPSSPEAPVPAATTSP